MCMGHQGFISFESIKLFVSDCIMGDVAVVV